MAGLGRQGCLIVFIYISSSHQSIYKAQFPQRETILFHSEDNDKEERGAGENVESREENTKAYS